MPSTKISHGVKARRVIDPCVTSRGIRLTLCLLLTLGGYITVGSTHAQTLLAQSDPSAQAANAQLFMPLLHDAARAAQAPPREEPTGDTNGDASIPPTNNPNGNNSSVDNAAPAPPLSTTTVTTTIVPDPGVPDPAPEEQDSPEGSAISGLTFCPDGNSAEAALATAMYQHHAQGRATMHCDPRLMAVARHRATDMAVRDYIAHQTPEGLGPNQLVVAAGYPLPADYSLENGSNNIESIAAGNADPLDVWETWLSLETHRVHLLALDTFFARQTYYGIGYVYMPDSTYRHYWVVLTAPIPETDAESD